MSNPRHKRAAAAAIALMLALVACTRTEVHDAGVIDTDTRHADSHGHGHGAGAVDAGAASTTAEPRADEPHDAGSVADFERLHAVALDVNWRDIRQDPQAECTLTRGTWRRYGNGCRDDCNLRVDAECTFSMTWGCDCGPDRCTARKGFKETCVPNPIWHKRVYRGAVVERPVEPAAPSAPSAPSAQ